MVARKRTQRHLLVLVMACASLAYNSLITSINMISNTNEFTATNNSLPGQKTPQQRQKQLDASSNFIEDEKMGKDGINRNSNFHGILDIGPNATTAFIPYELPRKMRSSEYRWYQLEQEELMGKHRMEPSSEGSDGRSVLGCTCLNSYAEYGPCCKRVIYRSHKMGSVLVSQLLRKFGLSQNVMVTDQIPMPRNFSFQQEQTLHQRDAVVIRNLQDSIVSGYLYHKQGRECSTNFMGKVKDNFTYSMLKVNWTKYLAYQEADELVLTEEDHRMMEEANVSPLDQLQWPNHGWEPVGGRNICEYLEEESEEDGLRLFTEFALNYWYGSVIRFHERVTKKQNPGNPRVLFVCYEDLAGDPVTQARTVQNLMDWLFPGAAGSGQTYRVPKKMQQEYMGNHSTSRDPELRQRLAAIVQRLDATLFGNRIARADETTGCGKISPPEEKEGSADMEEEQREEE